MPSACCSAASPNQPFVLVAAILDGQLHLLWKLEQTKERTFHAKLSCINRGSRLGLTGGVSEP